MSDVKLRIIHVTCFGKSYAITVPQNVGSLWNKCVSFVFIIFSNRQVKKNKISQFEIKILFITLNLLSVCANACK